jgi:hypothetical protein
LTEISALGHRRAGTDAELEAGHWLATHLRRVGLNPLVDAVTYEAYLPLRVELVVEGHPGELFPSAFAAWRTRPTGPDGVTAQLEYVGYGVEIDDESQARFLTLRGRTPGGFATGQEAAVGLSIGDVAGKIVVADVNRIAGYLDANGKAVYHAARQAGAVGCVLIDDKPLNAVSPHSLKMAGSTDLADLPGIILGGEDGARLRALMEHDSTRARMTVEASVTPWKSENIYAILPGVSRQVVLITSPHDSFFEGATDSGAGLAGLAALAGHCARTAENSRPTRTLVFLSTTGHYAAGGAGIRAFIERHREWIERDFLVNVHLGNGIAGAETRVAGGELVATGRASTRQLFVSNHPFLSAIAHPVLGHAGLTDTLRPVPAAVFNIGEHTHFAELGVGHIAVMGAPSYADSELDTLDRVSPAMMSRILNFATGVIDEILEMPIEHIQYRLDSDARAIQMAAARIFAGVHPDPPPPPLVRFHDVGGGELEFEVSGCDAARYLWDFGDGSPTFETETPARRHRYGADGRYHVTVLAVDAVGNATRARTNVAASWVR